MAYCTVTDLRTHGLRPDAYEGKTPDEKQGAINACASLMDGYLGSRYTLPILAPFPDVLVVCNAALASCDLIDTMGRDPNPEGPDALVDIKRKFWMDWLREVRDEEQNPPVIDSSPGSTPGATASITRVISSSSRGFSKRGATAGRWQSD